MTTPLGSVVIPAHNEQAVILSGLDALFEGFDDGEIDVVVVCNGCTDSTADLARGSGHPVTVVEISTASKPAALREGDSRAIAFPRIYLDADVRLPGSSARAVLERLRSARAHAARPPLAYDSTGASAVVRSYFRARSRLPTVMSALWGAGAYGLSAAGRERFRDFPDLQADDFFVDQQFAANEIDIVPCAPVAVSTPRRVRQLLAVLRRTYRGKSSVRDAADTQRPNTAPSAGRDLLRSAGFSPRAAADAIVYVGFSVLGRLGCRPAGDQRWERDDSSRVPVSA
jgi:glycosyltransferase involved in cell wall biosynthesis